MSTEALDQLLSQISVLSESEKAELAQELLMSLDGPGTNPWNTRGTTRLFDVCPKSETARPRC